MKLQESPDNIDQIVCIEERPISITTRSVINSLSCDELQDLVQEIRKGRGASKRVLREKRYFKKVEPLICGYGQEIPLLAIEIIIDATAQKIQK
ncbi:hypothetical protein KKD70_01910, partial [Patescibacteria group bacterium]|nr:hypothetical protein [Patescibacteria group bacterium]